MAYVLTAPVTNSITVQTSADQYELLRIAMKKNTNQNWPMGKTLKTSEKRLKALLRGFHSLILGLVNLLAPIFEVK